MTTERKPICPVFNEVVIGISGMLFPGGFQVTTEQPTFTEVKELWYKTNTMKVNMDHSDKTVFCDHHINYRFRAWHDWTHILLNADFEYHAELRVMEAQVDFARYWMMLRGYSLAQRQQVISMIRIEVGAQLEYEKQYGTFPEDQYQFTLDHIKQHNYYQLQSHRNAV